MNFLAHSHIKMVYNIAYLDYRLVQNTHKKTSTVFITLSTGVRLFVAGKTP